MHAFMTIARVLPSKELNLMVYNKGWEVHLQHRQVLNKDNVT